jgi:hypothetical protein
MYTVNLDRLRTFVSADCLNVCCRQAELSTWDRFEWSKKCLAWGSFWKRDKMVDSFYRSLHDCSNVKSIQNW